MQCEKKDFGQWEDAYTITHGSVKLCVVTAIGPRILSLQTGDSDNLLFVDTHSIARNDWHIYGGHRIWWGPETEQCYAPDNEPCAVEVASDLISITAPIDPVTKLQKVLRIRPSGEGFCVENCVRNAGEMLASGTIWALTCIRPDAQVFFPWGTPEKWDVKKICYWRSWATEHRSTLRSAQWEEGDDLFVIRPTGEEGKVGTTGYEGWIAATFPGQNATFCKSFTYMPGAHYSDEGCALECYTCAHFIELETLSPYYVLHPGEEMTQRELWHVYPKAVDVSHASSARACVGKTRI